MSPGAEKYTDCFSAGGQDRLNNCPRYYTKLSDAEAPVMLDL